MKIRTIFLSIIALLAAVSCGDALQSQNGLSIKVTNSITIGSDTFRDVSSYYYKDGDLIQLECSFMMGTFSIPEKPDAIFENIVNGYGAFNISCIGRSIDLSQERNTSIQMTFLPTRGEEMVAAVNRGSLAVVKSDRNYLINYDTVLTDGRHLFLSVEAVPIRYER
ncbi:MAG: hypothetical protein J5669_05355 [Bacteroidales bacterium]|nr:hypothetical protein [Bacteroidales bacterium]